MESYGEKGISVESLIEKQIEKAKKNDRSISREEAFDEVVADSCESFLQDSNAAVKIAALEAKDKTLAQKIRTFIGQLLAKVRKLLSGTSPDSAEGKLVREMSNSLENLHKLWSDALADAGKSYRAVSANMKDKRAAQVKLSDRFSYEYLVSKPDMKIISIYGNIPGNRADVVALAKKNAASIGNAKKDGSVSVYVKDIDRDVVLGTSGLRHGLDRRFDINAPVTIKIGEILHNSIMLNEMTPSKETASDSYVLIGAAAKDNGQFYVVRSVVNRYSNELGSIDTLYAVNAKSDIDNMKKRNQSGDNPQGTREQTRYLPDSTISISQLLDFVNNYFPDILPEDVLSHYGYASRPKGDLGKSVLHSDRDPDAVSNRDVLANALKGAAKTEGERKWLEEYQRQIGAMDKENDKLDMLRAERAKLRKESESRNRARIEDLSRLIAKSEEKINRYDRQLLEIEAGKPLRELLSREKKAAADKIRAHREQKLAKQRTEFREQKQRASERHDKTTILYTQSYEK